MTAHIHPPDVDVDELLADLHAINAFLSHDLRSPMRFIHAFAQILGDSAQDKLTPDELQNIRFIKDGVRQMEQMVADVLRYTRLDHRAVDRKKMDTEKSLKRSFNRVRDKRRGPDATLTIQRTDPIVADPDFVGLALDELFDNAFKFASPDRPLVIRAGTFHDGEGSGIVVEDNGIGFDPAHTGEVFALFRRLSNFGEFEGSGVGLALVRRIAHRHGADARIQSQPGVGTTTYLYLTPSA